MADTAATVYPVFNNVFKFGIGGLASTDQQMQTPANLENFAPTIDGTMEEWTPMESEGWGESMMTGKKLSFDFSGKRTYGDAANDYIAGLAWKSGNDVVTKMEWTMPNGASLKCDVVINVKAPSGGDSTNIDKLEFTAQCKGKPVYTAPAA